MIKDQSYRLLDALKTWLPDNGFMSNGVNHYPRIEVYISSGGTQIDKGDNSKASDIVFDVITENRNGGKALKIAEDLQDKLLITPVVVVDFDVDMVLNSGLTGLEEESSDDERTINRVLVNYSYTLTQTNF